ncbi:uncharacterized protein L201_000197 [Kwoniella dendrophila CBS 6074]|uniref:Ricin B lectin domain-containing protein n=1 Tax=Kwoniella dendrophila CBS 6074 TaxID=1295534 RepID=A0AAX4JIP8_9TREE
MHTLYFLAIVTAVIPFNLSFEVRGHPLKGQDSSTGLYISSIRDGTCLSSNESVPVKGSTLVTDNCDNARTWHVPSGGGLIGLDTVALAWDMDNQGDGVSLTEPSSESTTQSWKWSSDNRISTNNGSTCLQHTPNGPKTAQCDPLNVDQVWTLRNSSRPQRWDDIAKQNDLDRNGYIHPLGRKDICLSAISSSTPHTGIGVAMTYCSGKGDGSYYLPISTSETLFKWDLPSSPSSTEKIQITLSSRKDLCLETGFKKHNGTGYDWEYIYGMGLTIENCDSDEQGQWWIWNGKSFKVANDDKHNQCLNVLGGAGPYQITNFLNLRPMQLWTCDETDENSVSQFNNSIMTDHMQ